MKKPKKVNEVFPNVITNDGIFTLLENIGVPWSEDIDGKTLDIEYMYNISGQKNISPLVRRILDRSETLTTENMIVISMIIYKMFSRNWVKLYNTLLFEYNPISNYDMAESETINGTDSGTRENTGTVGTVDTQTANGTNSGVTNDDIYGFDSIDAVGDTTRDTSTTSSTTANGSTTRTDNLSEETSGTYETERTLTRSGNIGVTTSQQMIESERALWLWNFIYNVVFPDVNKILCTDTYTNF